MPAFADVALVPNPRRDHLTEALLGIGVVVPFLYYGTQLVAAPFYPGYSFVSQVASMLGSSESTRPWVFNSGVMATGVAMLLAAIGYFRAYRRLGVHQILTWATSVALVASGASTLRAGWYPLPDPRHGGHPVLLIPMLMLPFLLTAASWKDRHARSLKVYLIATMVLLAIMVPFMSGMTGLNPRTYGGLFQRIFALTIFPPIAVCAVYLQRRIKTTDS